MRFALNLFALVLGLTVTSCRSSPEPSPEKPTVRRDTSTKGGRLTRSEGPANAGSTNAAAATQAPVLLPASGRIHSVSPVAPFVVVDYILGGMPPLQSTLDVFRGGQKVGQIRLSGPEQNGFVAADILSGILQVDDEVRVRGTE